MIFYIGLHLFYNYIYISSKKQFLSYVTGVKIADFYVSLHIKTI